ncbi:MAG: hypothetical protein V1915_03620 [Candidatus Bathyarchaeota archaeon]
MKIKSIRNIQSDIHTLVEEIEARKKGGRKTPPRDREARDDADDAEDSEERQNTLKARPIGELKRGASSQSSSSPSSVSASASPSSLSPPSSPTIPDSPQQSTMGFKEIKLPDGRIIMLPMVKSEADALDNQKVDLAHVLQKSGVTTPSLGAPPLTGPSPDGA